MILSDRDIRNAMAGGEIVIDPFDPRLLKRNSYLLRLDSTFRRIETTRVVDSAVAADYAMLEGIVTKARSVVIDSSSLTLACSHERLSVSDAVIGLLSGISNVARLGVMVHCTSQMINAGFAAGQPSRVVFEMATMGGMRVRMHAGTPVCHLIFARLQTPIAYPEESERTGQDGPGPSRLLQQFGHFYLQG